MASAAIHKTPGERRVAPYLSDYAATCRAFTWEIARSELSGMPGGGLNMGYELRTGRPIVATPPQVPRGAGT